MVWTRIRRGREEGPASAIGSTSRGPWTVNVLTLDRRAARGRLVSTVGPDLARPETTSWLVRNRGGLFGINGGFFAHTSSKAAPGDPIGVSVVNGLLASEPLAGSAAIGMTVDGRTRQLAVGSFRYRATATNLRTGRRMWPVGVNRPPVVPAGCADSEDQRDCPEPGQLVTVSRLYSGHTPSGPGVEAIVDGRGCLQRIRVPRGGRLSPGQLAYQATGAAAGQLRDLVEGGCVALDQRLYRSTGSRVKLTAGTSAVNGRAVLVRGGRVVDNGSGSRFAARHPRSVAGRTAGGSIVLVTIDGRRTSSVGASLTEAAAVARALGLVEAVNLDGGGSTTMVVRGKVVNQVSERRERPVGDALVYLP